MSDSFESMFGRPGGVRRGEPAPPAAKKPDWSTLIGTTLGTWGSYFIDGWLIMLFLGTLHSEWSPAPALGYWICVFAAVVGGQVVGTGINGLYQRVKSITPDFGKK